MFFVSSESFIGCKTFKPSRHYTLCEELKLKRCKAFVNKSFPAQKFSHKQE